MNVAGMVLGAGNGRVGGFILGALAWWVEGISGGIHEGLGEGMAIVWGAKEGLKVTMNE